MNLDLNKPLQTRDGRKARFLGRINHPSSPLAFAITNSGFKQEYIGTSGFKQEYIGTRGENGELGFGSENSSNIINVPEKPEVTYSNVYSGRPCKNDITSTYWGALEDAKRYASPHATCILERTRVGDTVTYAVVHNYPTPSKG
jgi:hypothetical protein